MTVVIDGEEKVGDLIRRTANGRPYIVDPDTGKEVTYTRVSTFAKSLSDGDALSTWRLRTMVRGLLVDPGILNVALKPLAELGGDLNHPDLLDPIKAVVAMANEAGGGNAAADWGTTLHHFADIIDFSDERLTRDRWEIDDSIWEALDNYVQITADMEMLSGEEFVVCDELRTAGSYDRTARWRGKVHVADLKTGAVRFPDHAMQMAIYAHSKRYDHLTGTRIPGAIDEVDKEVGLIIHLPRPGVRDSRGQQVRPSVIPVDLREGWRLAHLGSEVRTARNAKLALPLD